MEANQDRERAWAGVFNGAMFTLFGAALPAVILWQIAADWPAWVAGTHKITAAETARAAAFGLLGATSLWLGIRMITRRLSSLRKAPRP